MADIVDDLLQFLSKTPTSFSAVNEVESILRKNDFIHFNFNDNLKVNQGYIYKRHSSLIAFILGEQPILETGFRLSVAHTDSPGFKIKQQTIKNDSGYLTVGLQVYGSPIFSTWYDRDLAIAGRAISYKNNKFEERLLDSRKPIAIIPNLAIHLNREINQHFKL